MGFSQFATVLSRGVDRPVVDRTGITGIFNLRLRFAKDAAVSGFFPPSTRNIDPPARLQEVASEPAGPSVFTAIQEQLRLKLEPSRAPGEFLVIDRVERPTEN